MTDPRIAAPRAWYPNMPPAHPDETNDDYTNRLIGYSAATGGPPRPYDHNRNRQCSIGYHDECSQRIGGSTIGATGRCACPHHTDPRLAILVHAIDVLGVSEGVALLADIDAPLRALAEHWRDLGGQTGASITRQLSAILEGRARERDGQWVIENPDGSHDLLVTDNQGR